MTSTQAGASVTARPLSKPGTPSDVVRQAVSDHPVRSFFRCLIAAQAAGLTKLKELLREVLQEADVATASVASPSADTASVDEAPPWSTSFPALDELSVNRIMAVRG